MDKLVQMCVFEAQPLSIINNPNLTKLFQIFLEYGYDITYYLFFYNIKFFLTLRLI